MASASVLGQRTYNKFEDEEVEGKTACQSEVALRFEPADGVAKAEDDHSTLQSQMDSSHSIVGRPQAGVLQDEVRDAATSSRAAAHENEIKDSSALLSTNENGHEKELTRLRNENMALRDEVERLKSARQENSELKQVVAQLKKVVVSYGFSEMGVMNAKPKKNQEGMEQLRYAPRELFIIIAMKFFEIASYYGTAYIYTNFLTEELDFSDQGAGNLYAAFGLISTLAGLPAGLVIDKLGVRKSLLIGTTASLCARLWTGLTGSPVICTLISLTLYPLGCSFGVPVLALGIRRYSHKDNRKFAFSIFYTMLMLATLLGTMVINQIRGFFPVGMEIFGWHLSWMRIIFMMCSGFTLLTVIGAYSLREIQVVDDQPLEDMIIEPVSFNQAKGLGELKRILLTPRFRRLTLVSLVFCGVQGGFRHLDATFPKYMMRTYGPNAPWEVILSVNPVVTFFCAPICTAILIKYKVGFRKALLLGAFLTGVSPFILSAFESYIGAVGWITVMSLGQAIWGPKLYEYSTMSAPTGREGLFVAITAAPIYLSSVPVGVMSGWLLQHYCPKNANPEDRHNRALWFWVGCSVISSPILLWTFRKSLLKRGEDKPPEQDQSVRVENQDPTPDQEQKLPDVPSAEVEEYDAPITFGNAGAAWAGFDMGRSLDEDSDEDFREEDSRERPAQEMASDP